MNAVRDAQMPSPFPGMNPYPEHPELWLEVHHMLISVLAETLTQQLLPKYRGAIDKRIYYVSGDEALLVGIPDVTVDRLICIFLISVTLFQCLPYLCGREIGNLRLICRLPYCKCMTV
jgi:hypothetical protein